MGQDLCPHSMVGAEGWGQKVFPLRNKYRISRRSVPHGPKGGNRRGTPPARPLRGGGDEKNSTSSTDSGDSRPTADGHVSYRTAGALCRFPMRPAVVPVQARATMKKARWKVTSTLKLATAPAPNSNRAPV
jgi:hypothetical protein